MTGIQPVRTYLSPAVWGLGRLSRYGALAFWFTHFVCTDIGLESQPYCQLLSPDRGHSPDTLAYRQTVLSLRSPSTVRQLNTVHKYRSRLQVRLDTVAASRRLLYG